MNIGETGIKGENKVCRYLMMRGYKILDRNFQCRFGEIDIIAKKKEYIVFVEVKTRNVSSKGLPREYVDYYKQQRIIKTAQVYLAFHPGELQPRFDVAEVWNNKNRLEVNYIKSAFDAS